MRSIAWPTTAKPAWTVRLADGQLSVDDRTGAVSAEPGPAGGTMRLMRRLHDGTGMPMLWRVLIFLGGILPAALAVTGITMWWRARRWRSKARRPQMAVA